MEGLIEITGRMTLLLQQEERHWGQLLFALIFVLIWVISAIVGAISKRRQRQQPEWEVDEEAVIIPPPRREPQRFPPAERRIDRPAPPPPLPRRIEPPVEAPRPMPTTRRQPRPARTPVRTFPTGATARLPDRAFPQPGGRVAATEVALPTPGDLTTTAPPHRPPATMSPLGLQQWLSSQNLREHYILTEIFQPPLALREGGSHRQ